LLALAKCPPPPPAGTERGLVQKRREKREEVGFYNAQWRDALELLNANWPRPKLAAALDVHRETVGKWLNGRNRIPEKAGEHIMRLLQEAPPARTRRMRR
jgi:deoxyadenosine/deoxycytidine kinase